MGAFDKPCIHADTQMRTSDTVDEILGTRWYSGGGGDSAISFQNVLTHILNLHWLFLAICNAKSASFDIFSATG